VAPSDATFVTCKEEFSCGSELIYSCFLCQFRSELCPSLRGFDFSCCKCPSSVPEHFRNTKTESH
jgi:hypothetical protein